MPQWRVQLHSLQRVCLVPIPCGTLVARERHFLQPNHPPNHLHRNGTHVVKRQTHPPGRLHGVVFVDIDPASELSHLENILCHQRHAPGYLASHDRAWKTFQRRKNFRKHRSRDHVRGHGDGPLVGVPSGPRVLPAQLSQPRAKRHTTPQNIDRTRCIAHAHLHRVRHDTRVAWYVLNLRAQPVPEADELQKLRRRPHFRRRRMLTL
mmetsp:Transcript_13926/g.39968  ORF Transcript_13926/g.39968 Transcript_13926/m.39968 type:complete len:207 (+) Transcript_13926:1378-1998(+)